MAATVQYGTVEAIQNMQADLIAILRATGNNGAIVITDAITDLDRIAVAAAMNPAWIAREEGALWISE